MFGGAVVLVAVRFPVVEKNLNRLTVFTGAVWAVCIVGLGILLKVDCRRLVSRVGANPGANVIEIADPGPRLPARRSVPQHPKPDSGGARGWWQRDPRHPGRSGSDGRGRARRVRAPQAGLLLVRQRARDPGRLRQRRRRAGVVGLPPLRTARRAGQTGPAAGSADRAYKTHLAYVRERRSDADGDALLEEARPSSDPPRRLSPATPEPRGTRVARHRAGPRRGRALSPAGRGERHGGYRTQAARSCAGRAGVSSPAGATVGGGPDGPGTGRHGVGGRGHGERTAVSAVGNGRSRRLGPWCDHVRVHLRSAR